MSIPQYHDNGPIKATSEINLNSLRGKSVIITGGASGLGKAYATAFANAGAFVTIGDFDEIAGKATEKELSPNAKFVKCDVRDWDQQVAVFDAALAYSPHKSIDVVIANAGVVGADDLNNLDDPSQPPVKPNLRIVEINLIGTAYTAKLALHFFRRQPQDPSRDRCLIIKGSVAAYADQPGSPQYNISKWGARGLFRNLRRTAWREGIRVNFVAPWYVRTPILSDKVIQYLESKGVNFATVDDCARAMVHIASDKDINGRALGIVPREEASEGYMDLQHDDYQDGDFLKGWQEIVLATAESIVTI
ncbi:short chain dehydrogenase reductase [Ilyonectria sp. MPI-CAGE-AT-0026]|nr:short chain dehydrogenase reductase [Ilyonectria sp. MPI-CAGE-AT-0026]